MTYKSPLLLAGLVGVLGASSLAHAGNEKRNGQSSGQQLLVPVGAVGTALAGAPTASISGLEAIYWNPAGLAASPGSAGMFSYTRWLADINVSYAAVSTSFGRFGSLGLSFKAFDFGEISRTDEDNPDGNGTYSPTFLTVGLTYSKQMTDRILFGMTGKMVSERIVQTSATGFGVDVGLQYRTSANGLKLGVALKNLGTGLRYSGSDLEQKVQLPGQQPGAQNAPLSQIGQKADFPTTFEIGVGYDVPVASSQTLSVMGNFRSNNYGNDNYQLGAQYALSNIVFLRGGYDLLAGESGDSKKDAFNGLSLGAGLNYAMSGTGQISFDYAYKQTQLLSNGTQWFTVKIGF